MPLPLLQNLVITMSMLVAWVIPDVPKNISEQLKKEKTLLVDVFLNEEKEKLQLIQSLFSRDLTQEQLEELKVSDQTSLPLQQTQPGPLPPTLSPAPRTRPRAASFSQFTRQMSMSPRSDITQHTAVWGKSGERRWVHWWECFTVPEHWSLRLWVSGIRCPRFYVTVFCTGEWGVTPFGHWTVVWMSVLQAPRLVFKPSDVQARLTHKLEL